ncbi:MAG: ribosomal protein [Chlamydiota bacterium]|jgi:large subunit ribosomal protein L15
MFKLSTMKDTSRPPKRVQRVGRGIGSKRGETCGRGGKGDSARQGYRKRFGYEGGQVPLYRKLPIRGFTRGTFVKPVVAISLKVIDQKFSDGEIVNMQTLRSKGLIPRVVKGGVKILSQGEITKKIKIEAHFYSEAAKQKLDEKKIHYTIVGNA